MSKADELYDQYFFLAGFVVDGHAMTLPAYRKPEKVAFQFSQVTPDNALCVTDIQHSQEYTYTGHVPHFYFKVLTKKFFQQSFKTAEFSFSAEEENIGHVRHVVGRSGEEYIGRGSTNQSIGTLELQGKFDPAGLMLRIRGTLSKSGGKSWQDATVAPELAKDGYDIEIRAPWRVIRFIFDVLYVQAMYERVQRNTLN
jgi:hypothetical protein